MKKHQAVATTFILGRPKAAKAAVTTFILGTPKAAKH
jgi:hypothetical protein